MNDTARALAAADESAHQKSLTLVEQLWQKLDAAYTRWRRYRKHGEELPTGISLDMMEGRVTGLVEALAIMSYPATEDQIKRETLRRWKERQPTPGKFES